MLNGVAAAFAQNASLSGNLKADYACIEVDEASSSPRVFPHFKPDFMVLTNLFRDQLDRYGEIDITMNLLKEAMEMAPEMEVIVNADDSLSTYLGHGKRKSLCDLRYRAEQYFEDQIRIPGEIREGPFCKKCGSRMEYHFYHYSQLGDYYCPNCGLQTADSCTYNATDVKVSRRG